MSFLRHLLPAWKRGIEDKRRANAAILASLDRELKDTEVAAIEGKVLLSLNTATGEWLDQYGKMFGVLRMDAEQDDHYRQRMIKYVLLKRGTIPAIKEAIQAFLQNYDSEIEIYEPYTNVFTLNKSKLNGPDHLLGHYYTVAVIDIRIPVPFPIGLIDVINEFKPAGVTVRLTYRPGAYNPNAPIIGGEGDQIEGSTKLKIMTGMNDRIRGHLNLTARSRQEGEDSGIFFLNRSKLNSKDRLTGAYSVTSPTYNLATYAKNDVVFTKDATISYVQSNTTPMSSDFYSKTGEITEQYATQVVDGTAVNYLHFTMDVATFFFTKYNDYLREAAPNGVYTKETFLSFMENPTLQYRVKAAVSPTKPTLCTMQLLNMQTEQWDDLNSDLVRYEVTGARIELNSLENYLSDGGLIFARLKVNANPAAGSYEIHTHFFEIGFNKEIAIRPTIRTGVRKAEFGDKVTYRLLNDETNIINENYMISDALLIEPMESMWTVKNALWGTNI